jgi:hypothetical protein
MKKLGVLAIVVCILLSACSTTQTNVDFDSVNQIEPTTPPMMTATQTVEIELPTIEPTMKEETKTPTESVPEPTLTPTIVHETQPEVSRYLDNQTLNECNTGYRFKAGDAYHIPSSCDSWLYNLLERPVSKDRTVFYPYLDIITASAGLDENWYFIRLELFEAEVPEDVSAVTYFVEIDVDFNGSGDYLIAVENVPLSKTDWSVSGLKVWQDENQDVYGDSPVYADQKNTGDGYELLIFNAGLGDDADIAWVRRTPDSPETIEFAFKKTMLQGSELFMWWVGAMKGVFSPTSFDLVDKMSDLEFYGIDTTCGWSFGRHVIGYPKQCYIPTPTTVPVQVQSESQPDVCVKGDPPTSDPCWIWFPDKCEWICFN